MPEQRNPLQGLLGFNIMDQVSRMREQPHDPRVPYKRHGLGDTQGEMLSVMPKSTYDEAGTMSSMMDQMKKAGASEEEIRRAMGVMAMQLSKQRGEPMTGIPGMDERIEDELYREKLQEVARRTAGKRVSAKDVPGLLDI